MLTDEAGRQKLKIHGQGGVGRGCTRGMEQQGDRTESQKVGQYSVFERRQR